MKYFSLLFILFAISCQPKKGETYEPSKEFTAQLEKEIAGIDETTELKTYLEHIHHLDQKFRKMESNVLEKYGYDSEEHQLIWEIIDQTDQQNILRVKALLKKFGYPAIEKVGKKAALTPWLVIHHSPNYQDRLENFRYIYSAYQNHTIDESAMDLFMDRMYRMKFHKSFEMPNPYQTNNKIDTLVKVLQLEAMVQTVSPPVQQVN